MITCKSKEGVPDNYFVPLFAQSGSLQPDMSATQHKTYFINRKERNEIQYHHGLSEGHSYDNPATSESFLAYGKNVGRANPFLFRPVINAKILVIYCYAIHQPECRPLGKVILRHFSCALRTSSDKCFGAGSRGVPEPIQPMSLLNLGLWRLLAGFFPKAGIRLPLLRNFRNRRKRL
jgi:hypothetical protein